MFSYVKRVSQMYKKIIKFIQEKKKTKKNTNWYTGVQIEFLDFQEVRFVQT